MVRALLRRSVIASIAVAAGFIANGADAQGIDSNIVSRIESFIPPNPETVLSTKTKKVPVKRTEQVTVTVEEKQDLTEAEREAKAREMGVVVPQNLRSTTARKAYLNLRNVPTYRLVKRRKQKTRVVTEIVEKKLPRKTVVRGIATLGYSYASNANQVNIGIVADSIDNQNANLLILVPAGREEDTVSILLGPTAVRYATLGSSSFDALNGSVTYTRLLGRRQTVDGLATSGTARTDLFTIGLSGVSVYEPGLGPHQIAVATPSIGWSRSNIGLGTRLCGEKGSEAYCYYADVSASLIGNLADISSQTNASAVLQATIGWRPPVKKLSLSVTGSLQAVQFSDYPGGRQDLVFVGSGDLGWSPRANMTFGAGVKFTQQLSSQSDLDWNGFSAYPQATLNMKF
jgi:hypothetical protein